MTKLIVFVLAAVSALAQEQWTAVMRIADGASTTVKRQGVKARISGKFAGASEEAIRINGQGGVTSIPKSEVEQVSVARKRKTRNALLGAAIGGGAGAGAVGGIARGLERKDADSVAHGFAALGLVIGLAAGTVLGLASGAGYTPVYEVSKR